MVSFATCAVNLVWGRAWPLRHGGWSAICRDHVTMQAVGAVPASSLHSSAKVGRGDLCTRFPPAPHGFGCTRLYTDLRPHMKRDTAFRSRRHPRGSEGCEPLCPRGELF